MTYKIQLGQLAKSFQTHGQLLKHVTVQVHVLDSSELRTRLVRVNHVFDRNIREHAIWNSLQLVVRS